MTKLTIASGLKLDADYVGGGTFALLAKKGAGKSYTARVMAEEFWDANVPFVLLDPMGTQWGLRASADGEGEGIPVAIFGGPKGDVPLERKGGALIADLVVDEGVSMILDMSELGSRAAEREFAMDFLDRLYRRNSDLVHLLMDEADLFAPQNPRAGDQPLLGITENIVRRGRNRGIGITMISQRPAVLNKDVLTQVDGLVALRVTGKTDLDAIDAWVKAHDDEVGPGEVRSSLPRLQNGESWWWVPELGILKRVQVRGSRTFDSSPTKKRGGNKREPKTFADIDMGAIEEKMAATIERAKADDPAALRKQVAALQKELRSRPDTAPEPVTETVEVPVVPEDLALAVIGLNGTADAVARELREIADRVVGEVQAVVDMLPGTRETSKLPVAQVARAGNAESKPRQPPARPRQSRDSGRVARRPAPARTNGHGRETPPPDGEFRPSSSQQRILDTLAWFEVIGVDAPKRPALAPMAGTKSTSGGFKNNLGALRSAGLIDYPEPNRVALTHAGQDLAIVPTVPATAEALQEAVLSSVTGSQATILDRLIQAYPEAMTREELAADCGVPVTSGGFKNNLGALRTLELLDYPAPGEVVALPILFPTLTAA